MANVEIREIDLGHGTRGLVLENAHLAVTILPDKGADIHAITHKGTGIDPMWKSPWGFRRPGTVATASTSGIAWLETYAGGWQELFPNAGTGLTHHGAELPVHGEASLIGWEWEPLASGDGTRLSTRLFRSPFSLERVIRLDPDAPVLIVEGKATNHGREAIEYMWGHHPAFGAPFLDGDCRIFSNATALHADPNGPGPLLDAGATYDWPMAGRPGQEFDVARVPDEGEPRSLMAYLAGFPGDTAWAAVVNQRLRFGIGMAWSTADYPYGWLWEELHGSSGYPWYGQVYALAIEPNTSYPGGMAEVLVTTKTHRVMEPGATHTNRLVVSLFDDTAAVAGIDDAGRVTKG